MASVFYKFNKDVANNIFDGVLSKAGSPYEFDADQGKKSQELIKYIEKNYCKKRVTKRGVEVDENLFIAEKISEAEAKAMGKEKVKNFKNTFNKKKEASKTVGGKQTK